MAKPGRRVGVWAVAAIVVFFVATVGLLVVALSLLGKRRPTHAEQTYDMPPAQVREFVEAASGRFGWRQRVPDSLAYTTPAGDLQAQVRDVDGDAKVEIDGPRQSVDALKELLDRQIPPANP